MRSFVDVDFGHNLENSGFTRCSLFRSLVNSSSVAIAVFEIISRDIQFENDRQREKNNIYINKLVRY